MSVSVQVHRALAGIFGWSRTIEKTSALDIQIAETPAGIVPKILQRLASRR
jgi:hypothetical protein